MSYPQIPPRFVPTLTDVVPSATSYGPASSQSFSPPQHREVVSADGRLDSQFEDQMVHRVMQRVDLVLERRLREAVGQLILTHTQALGPRLREEIELVVRESVSQAVAQELPMQAQRD